MVGRAASVTRSRHGFTLSSTESPHPREAFLCFLSLSCLGITIMPGPSMSCDHALPLQKGQEHTESNGSGAPRER